MLNDETQTKRLVSPADTETNTCNGWPSAFLETLTQPDCILPSQFFRRGVASPVAGELRLLIAVLQDAINTYARTMNRKSRRHRQEFAEVNGWFLARNQRALFAFETVCEILGIEADNLRRWLQALRSAQGRAEAPMAIAGRRLDPLRRQRRILAGGQRGSNSQCYQRRATRQPPQVAVAHTQHSHDMINTDGSSKSARWSVCAS